jgi:rubrerythrin
MEIFVYALQFEKDGEAFYQNQAAAVKDKNLADIFTFLAKEERKHYAYIQNFKNQTDERPASIFLSDITNVFTRIRDGHLQFTEPKNTMTDVLTKAMKIEDESITYYRDSEKKIDDPRAKALLALLAKQEEVHYSLLSSIIEFYETPHLWMEQAEFSNLKDY